ncbi:hypothetical protein AMS68_002921 [Peltaster fructicola]|uniref:DUF7598 domain-containing protein n=1 Tax=Peltaster fructicola TaxID=286661 RepID=A0A6H0XRP5_9PEZI|nr:hypothetical protein AMS68_002921 [Peltaster fructicola]
MFLRLYPTEKLLYLPIEQRHFEKLTNLFHRPQKEDIESEKQQSNMVLSSKSLAGPGYIILNGIRVMNIIGFIAVITASIGMLVKTSTNSHFFFFDAVSHVVMTIVGMFLLVSELSLFPDFFARNWPLLSPCHGFVTLAVAMLVLGINILGNLNKDANSQDSLGMAFWQLRAHGAVAVSKTPMPGSGAGSVYTPSTPSKGNAFRITSSPRQEPILPSYHASTPNKEFKTGDFSPSSKYSRATNCTKKGVMSVFMGRKRESVGPALPINISAPVGVNPQFAHLTPQRPDSALHPSRTGESETQRWHA